MRRMIAALKKYGFLGFIIKLLKKIFYKIYNFFNKLDEKNIAKANAKIRKKLSGRYDELENLCKSSKYKYVFVFYPYSEWNLPVFQRPQQIALSLSKRGDILYLFCTANCLYDKVDAVYEKVNENLYVVSDYDFIQSLNITNKVLHLYSTDIVSDYSIVENALSKNEKVLYEYIDEIHESITLSAPDYYLKKHEQILKNENVYVITTADKLYNDALKYRKTKLALSTNGVNVSDFDSKELPVEFDSRLVDIKDKYEKIICYYGSLAVWFDYSLLKKCAKRYPNYAFVLIGMKYDNSFDKSDVESIENIIYLGKIPYNELINVTKDVDLLTIPFLINEITESTSPVKLFEYMATQKPILTTDMKECRKYKSVIIGKSQKDYIDKIESTIELINDKKYLDIEMKEATDNTWDSKAEIIVDLLKK